MLKTRKGNLKISLYDYLEIVEEVDLTDLDWDIETTLVLGDNWEYTDVTKPCQEDVDDEHKYDNYDRYVKLVLLNLPVIRKAKREGTVVCDCAGFIMNWYNAYKRFVNEENREEYTEEWYTRNGLDLSPDVDEGFYEVFLETFFQLLNGQYSERQYGVLTNYLLYEGYLRDYYGMHDEAVDGKPYEFEEWLRKCV